MNLFAYVRNNPWNWVDPMGLFLNLTGGGSTGTGLPIDPGGLPTLTTPTGDISESPFDTIPDAPTDGDEGDTNPGGPQGTQHNSQGKGERGQEKGRGDDPFYGLTKEQLDQIAKDPNSTPREKERASRIGKQKGKTKDNQSGKKRCPLK